VLLTLEFLPGKREFLPGKQELRGVRNSVGRRVGRGDGLSSLAALLRSRNTDGLRLAIWYGYAAAFIPRYSGYR